MPLPTWRLPRGVSRSLWEYAHDPAIAREDADHLAGSALIELDRRLVDLWLTQPGTLVDLGCGPGRIAVPLSQRGFQVLGIDLSPESLRVAQAAAREAGASLGLVRANLCEVACCPDGAFENALLLYGTLGMVEGAENRRAVLREAARLLQPGGRLVLHAHNVWAHAFHSAGRRWLLQDRWKALWGSPTAGDTRRDYRGIPGMYHHAFTLRELRSLLRDAGFKIRETVPITTDSSGRVSHPRWGWWFKASSWMFLATRSGVTEALGIRN